MIVRNYTPFKTLLFASRDVEGRELGVFVIRGTFVMPSSGALRPDPEQQAVVETDLWHGEANVSSVQMESDIVPMKPRSDVHVDAIAHAPGGRALSQWEVSVRVGQLQKRLRVTGPRRWEQAGGELRLTDPEPVAAVPLRYELAFGGSFRDEWGEESVCQENPIGIGFMAGRLARAGNEATAPQVESPEDPVVDPDRTYAPEGLGPLARSWQPRLARAGTFDDHWLSSRWPELPPDFDFTFYNGAHPDLIYPGHLKGNEDVEIEGLHPSGPLRFCLPGYEVGLLLRQQSGAMAVATAVLDTLHLDVERSRAHLTWRATFVEREPLRVIEARMTVPGGS